MRTLLDELSARVGAAFAAEGLDPALGQVRVSDRPDLAEFQCNGALGAAKAAKANPREIAGKIAARLTAEGFFAKVEIAGPGFLNLDLSADFLTARTRAVANSERAGGWRTESPRTVIVDYGGPNIAKPMHVGHLRSSIIGESVKRLFAYMGDRAVGDIHLGDWGLPMGMLISELEIRHPDWPYFREAAGFPAEPPFTMDELETVYPEAASACKGDPERLERARAATAALQAGEPGYRALWRAFVEVTRARLEAEFAALGVTFELWKGESDVDPLIAPMAEDLRAKGLLVESDGAEVIHVGEEGEAKDIPPLMVFKSDGAVTYGTTDLATILDRAKDPAPDLSLYVVDHRQSLHFEQVFRAAVKAGYAPRAGLEHLAYGTMNGPDGKPFKTREGGVMKLRDLLAQMTDAAKARLAEAGLAEGCSDAEVEDVARKVGLAAVKFADLSHDRTSNYVFEVDRFTRFEGKTGPYLLYAAVRIRSLLRKAGAAADLARAPMIRIGAPEERALALALCAFADMSRQAYERRAPNVLCDHAYALAGAFSSFYAACPVLGAQDDQVMASRLALSKAALAQLTVILGLLGLEAPERM